MLPVIFCTSCRMKRQARKVHGYGPQHRFGWWNQCTTCIRLYGALPPTAVRARRRQRSYVKASKQLLLGGGF
jgi:hypothetical protein